MFKKEIKDIIVPTLIRSSIILVIFLVVLIAGGFQQERSKSAFIFMLFSFIIYWIANNLGMTAFKSEIQDNAMEYLLTFPILRLRLVLKKISPRLLVLGILSALYCSSFYLYIKPSYTHNFFEQGFMAIYEPPFVVIFALFVFLAAFFVGLFDWRSIRIVIGVLNISFAAFLSGLVGEAIDMFSISFPSRDVRAMIVFLVSLGLVLIIMGIAYISVFRKLDTKPINWHRNKFILRAIIPLLILSGIRTIFFF